MKDDELPSVQDESRISSVLTGDSLAGLIGLLVRHFGVREAGVHLLEATPGQAPPSRALLSSAELSRLCAEVVERGEVVQRHCSGSAGEVNGRSTRASSCTFVGAPMLALDGAMVGAVYLLNSGARHFSDAELEDLSVFARMAARQHGAELAVELSRHQQTLQSAFDQAEHAIIHLDRELRITFLNASARRIFGLSVAGEGAHISVLNPAGWLDPPEREACERALGRGQSWHGEARHVVDGRPSVFDLSVSPTRDGAGNLSGALVILHDVTQERGNERLFQMLMQGAREIMAVHDVEGRLLYSNEGQISSSGRMIHPDVGRSGFDFMIPEDRERVRREGLEPALRGEHVTVRWRRLPELEMEEYQGSGEPRWMEASVTPVLNHLGQVEHLLVVSRDITEQRSRDEEMQLLRSAVMAAGQAVMITKAEPLDAPGPEVVFVNRAFTEMTGYAPADILGQSPRILQGPGTDPAALRRMHDQLRSWQEVDETVLNYTKDGQPFWVHFTIAPVADEKGWFTHWISVQRDVTEERLEQAYERARRQVLERVAAGEPLTAVLRGLIDLLAVRWPHLTASLLLLQHDRLHEAVPSALPESYREAVNGITIGPDVGSCGTAAYIGQTVVSGDLWTDPRWQPFLEIVHQHGLRACWSAPILSGNRTVLGTFALYSREPLSPTARELDTLEDTARLAAVILERYRALDDMQHLALFDALTDLPNRALFTEQLGSALGRLEEGQMLAVGLLDLDRFKTVNDSFGHKAADRLLVQIARRLEGALPRAAVLARMGGDEFTFIAEGLRAGELEAGEMDHGSTAEIEPLAQAVLSAFEAPFEVAGQELFISASLGIALAPLDARKAADLLTVADTAMYHAKERGLGWASLSFAPQPSARRHVLLETGLRRALEAGQLALHYQPILDRQGRVAELEALLRWDSPTLGSVSPAEFIPVAESTGLIIPIGAWVIRQACQDAARLQSLVPGVRMAVNVSLKQFAHPALVDWVQSALDDAGLRSGLLTLEITESVLMEQAEAVRRILKLREIGVRLAIDDFGTGYSSMKYLRELPIQCVKMDRMFVKSLRNPSDRDAQIVRAIAGLCQALELELTAEGIETAQQAELVQALGADLLQGWLYSRALPLSDVEVWIAERLRAAAPVVG